MWTLCPTFWKLSYWFCELLCLFICNINMHRIQNNILTVSTKFQLFIYSLVLFADCDNALSCMKIIFFLKASDFLNNSSMCTLKESMYVSAVIWTQYGICDMPPINLLQNIIPRPPCWYLNLWVIQSLFYVFFRRKQQSILQWKEQLFLCITSHVGL